MDAESSLTPDSWKHFVIGLALGLVIAAGVAFFSTRAVREIEATLNQQRTVIAAQQAQLAQASAATARCSAQLQASVARQIQLEIAVRQYQEDIQQGQVPTNLLTLLAKLLL